MFLSIKSIQHVFKVCKKFSLKKLKSCCKLATLLSLYMQQKGGNAHVSLYFLSHSRSQHRFLLHHQMARTSLRIGIPNS